MSVPSPGAHWQSAEPVQWFLDQRQQRLPLIDVQEDLIKRLFERHAQDVERFLDLGAGDGALSALMLEIFPTAEAVLVDFSDPMLTRVKSRLGGRGEVAAHDAPPAAPSQPLLYASEHGLGEVDEHRFGLREEREHQL